MATRNKNEISLLEKNESALPGPAYDEHISNMCPCTQGPLSGTIRVDLIFHFSLKKVCRRFFNIPGSLYVWFFDPGKTLPPRGQIFVNPQCCLCYLTMGVSPADPGRYPGPVTLPGRFRRRTSGKFSPRFHGLGVWRRCPRVHWDILGARLPVSGRFRGTFFSLDEI